MTLKTFQVKEFRVDKILRNVRESFPEMKSWIWNPVLDLQLPSPISPSTRQAKAIKKNSETDRKRRLKL